MKSSSRFLVSLGIPKAGKLGKQSSNKQGLFQSSAGVTLSKVLNHQMLRDPMQGSFLSLIPLQPLTAYKHAHFMSM